jgi:tetratricopeptide (TPR) repeat protein
MPAVVAQDFRAIVILSVSFLLSCSSVQSSSEHKPYYDAAYNDHNNPPEKMIPKVMMSEPNGVQIDIVSVRTQADYNFAMGETYSLEGQPQRAIESFKTVLIYDPDSVVVQLRLATEYVKLGMVSESIKYTESAIKLDPKKVEAYLFLGGLYSALKTYDSAIKQYEEVLKLDPNNSEAPLYLGAVYAEKKQFSKAIDFFKQAAKKDSGSILHLPWYYIGRVHLETKEYHLALKDFEKSLSIKKDFADGAVSLGGAYAKLNLPKKAIEVYQKFYKENGPNLKIAEILSQTYIEEEQFELALEQLRVLEEMGEDSLNVKVKMALIMIERKKYQEAIVKLKETLALEPSSDKIRFYLAAVYEEIKDYSSAVENYKLIPGESSYFADGVVHAAYLQKQNSDVSGAIKTVESALNKRTDNPQIYALYASLLDETSEYEKARTVLSGALVQFPENVQLHFFLGTIFDRLGKKDDLIKEMKKVISLDEKHVQAINYLAYTYAESALKLDEAEVLARRALSIEPEDGFVMDTLGWILFRQGRLKESVVLLEGAQRQQPKESIIAEHLGDVYIRYQLIEKAREMYELAAQLEKDTEKIKKIKQKISSTEVVQLPAVTKERKPASLSKDSH